MLSNLNPDVRGLLIAAIMLASGLVLGKVFDKLLKLARLRDRLKGGMRNE